MTGTPRSLALLLLLCSVPAAAASWRFDAEKPGALPEGFESYAGRWAVTADTSAPSAPNVLAQTATTETWPGVVLTGREYADVSVTVAFRPVSGEEDKAAGIIFRYRGPGNFYLCRANANEDNVVLFKFVDGKRIEIASGRGKVPAGRWSRLSVVTSGTALACYLGGKRLAAGEDSLYQKGAVGLWTKADSVTHFDDLRIVSTEPKKGR